jgi:small-conductance mechanosensitive channel
LIETGEVIRQANAQGQIVEYHRFYHKRTANHIPNAVSATMLQSKMTQEIVGQGVDGWCDEVVVVQHILTDDVYFYGYAAATESASPTFVIPVWVVLAVILSATVTVMFFGWLGYSFFTAVLEKALPTDRYTTGEGETTTSFTDYVSIQRQYYWLVCPICGMGFASKNDYPTWEQIPQEIHDAYKEHVDHCPGIRSEEAFPWLVPVAIGGVVITVVGVAWVVSQVFIKKELPPIIVTK